jgi:acetylacetone-cleaving enzyme
MIKSRVSDEGVGVDTLPWKEFPREYHTGGLQWKLLHVAPEAPSWTIMFRAIRECTARPHIHHGPAYVYQIGGEVVLGDHTAVGPAFGYEAAGASHPATVFKKGAEFVMTMFGPLEFDSEDGRKVVMTWQDAQRVWAE